MSTCLRSLTLALALSISAPASAQTVQTIANQNRCSTSGVTGLSNQLAETQMCMFPGRFVRFAPHSGVVLNNGGVRPYLQASARDALWRAASRVTVRVNSAFRTVADQYVLYHADTCFRPALPGNSNHQSGRALDVSNASSIRSAMEAQGCRWFGSSDPVHFDCPGSDLRSEAVRAFQRLWNINNPGDRIAEDGSYGPVTANRLSRSPANGFSRSGCTAVCTPSPETCNGNDDDCDGRTDEGIAARGCGSSTGRCERGTQRCSGGSWGSCEGGVSPRAERCDGIDDDCDGAIDDGLSRTCGSDVGLCMLGEQTCSAGEWGSCVGDVGPEPERCNELDDDCDGETDDEEVCEVEELVMQLPSYGRTDSDVDGDGRSDACAERDGFLECHLASGRGFERSVPGPFVGIDGYDDPAHFSTLRMGDIDGDGMADVCVRESGGVRCWASSGAGFDTELDGPPLSDANGFDRAPQFTTLRLGDLDGDGLSDLCARWSDGLRCYRSTGTGFEQLATLPELSDDNGYGTVARYGTLRMGDVNADGRDDVCVRDENGMDCWLFDGRDFDARVTGPRWSDTAGFDQLERWSTIRLADVDGDGSADLCARTPGGFECHPAGARGFGDPYLGPAMDADEGWDEPSQYATIRLGDVDGDGAADLCARDSEGLVCWLFTGRGFDAQVEGPRLSDADGWDQPERYHTLRMADVNRDGLADVCGLTDEGLLCWRSSGRSFDIVIPGPEWTGEGWTAPEHFGSLRLGGGQPRNPLVDYVPPPSEGCGCATPGTGSSRGGWFVLAFVGVVLRRRLRRGAGRRAR
ncbi:MAG: VCBS repeat-containing protein [Deltaproteobacteria bacterium]|nr:VCBS repeat-containing protein [Deltaproteobacteria bacterium]